VSAGRAVRAQNGRVIVDCALYRYGQRVEETRNLVKIAAAARKDDDAFVWMGLYEPSETDLEGVARLFGLHGLAVQDAVRAHQRPKIDVYDDSLFVVLRTLSYIDATSDVETGEIAMFVGQDMAITVRHGEGSELASVRHRMEQHPEVLKHGPAAVLYAVSDAVVDTYTSVANELQTDVDELERSVFSPRRTDDFERVYKLKRELQEFRRAVVPLVEPLTELAENDVVTIPADARPFFRDVLDHLLRVQEQVESLEGLLAGILQAHVAQVGLRQNEDMRKISAWVAILAVPTMIAGIYGMNFDNMPELHWKYGYGLAIGAMGVICFGLYRAFKRSGWL
jgi:magnesium transporter